MKPGSNKGSKSKKAGRHRSSRGKAASKKRIGTGSDNKGIRSPSGGLGFLTYIQCSTHRTRYPKGESCPKCPAKTS